MAVLEVEEVEEEEEDEEDKGTSNDNGTTEVNTDEDPEVHEQQGVQELHPAAKISSVAEANTAIEDTATATTISMLNVTEEGGEEDTATSRSEDNYKHTHCSRRRTKLTLTASSSVRKSCVYSSSESRRSSSRRAKPTISCSAAFVSCRHNGRKHRSRSRPRKSCSTHTNTQLYSSGLHIVGEIAKQV